MKRFRSFLPSFRNFLPKGMTFTFPRNSDAQILAFLFLSDILALCYVQFRFLFNTILRIFVFCNLFYNQNRSLIIKRLRTTMLTSYTILTYMYLHKKWFQKIQRYNHHTLCFKHFKIFQYSLFYLILLNVFEWNTFEGLSFFFLKYHNFYS